MMLMNHLKKEEKENGPLERELDLASLVFWYVYENRL